VQTLDCGSRQLARYPGQETVPGATMPLLAEVFELVKQFQAHDVMLNIETKVEAAAPEETAAREDFVRGVLAVIADSGIQNQLTIQSFDWGALMLVRDLAPDIPIVALTNGQSFLQCGEAGRSVWLGGLDIDDFNCDVTAAVASFGASALSPVHGHPQDGRIDDDDYVPFVTADMIQSAHSLGMKVIPWTVNDKASMTTLLELGVDGLITDYPDRLREVLAQQGRTLPRSYSRQQ
jgi:glycerophosphoryl diester phosphodiesterase